MNSDGYDKLVEDLAAKRVQLEQEMDQPPGTASN
jgi:hypothetical protein